MNSTDNTPKILYKIISTEQWEESQKKEDLILSKMDKEFIHFATEEQVEAVISKFWNNEPSFYVLEVDSSLLPGNLKYETNPGRPTKYYHLYNGSIPLKAIKTKQQRLN